jgi:G:T-mismatch repair DNA endonuclease (very short patch repair protein)
VGLIITIIVSIQGKTGYEKNVDEFEGIGIEALHALESLFRVSIVVFRLAENNIGTRIWSSNSSYSKKLNLNLHENHFSLIKDVNQYAKNFFCDECRTGYSSPYQLGRHICRDLDKRLSFPTGCYRAKQTIFDWIHDRTGLLISPYRRIYPYRITFDIESFMEQEELPECTEKLNYISRHRLMSVSVCSNVPDFEEPICFISEGNERDLIVRFAGYIREVQEKSFQLLKEDFSDVLEFLDETIASEELVEKEFADSKFSNPGTYFARSLSLLKDRFIDYLRVIPVIGFNSGSYDLNVMKGGLMRYLHDTGKIKFVIKRNSRLQCVQTDSFRFLDMMNYLTPNTSYAKYLKTFGIEVGKGFFPYDYVTSLQTLEETSLPPHEAFESKLTRSNITAEEYAYCHKVWTENGMKTMADFLTWYNNLDVKPFQEAIKVQSKLYEERGIDMFKDAVSIPGVAVQWSFDVIKKSGVVVDIPLISKKNSDLYHTVRNNIVGGPSIIFHRYHEKGVTRIRQCEYGQNSKLCQRVVGFDANALYLWSQMQAMPTGTPIRRRRENGFKPEFVDKYGRLAWEWLELISSDSGKKIEHKYNSGEYKVGRHGLPVDGFCRETNTVYQFHGCLFHGHACSLTSSSTHNPINGTSFEELRRDTKEKETYIRRLGYKLVTIYECEWNVKKESNDNLKRFVKSIHRHTMTDKREMTENQIISAMMLDQFFGLIECDIAVPPHLRQKFSEMSPIFKNVSVGREHVSAHMREYCKQTDSLKTPQRMLIGSLSGTKILLLNPLAKWYVNHGLEITHIHQIVQFIPLKCFECFGDSVTEARRAGDVSPDKALLAETSKLVGNSVYGKMITNKENHRNVAFVSDEKKNG